MGSVFRLPDAGGRVTQGSTKLQTYAIDSRTATKMRSAEPWKQVHHQLDRSHAIELSRLSHPPQLVEMLASNGLKGIYGVERSHVGLGPAQRLRTTQTRSVVQPLGARCDTFALGSETTMPSPYKLPCRILCPRVCPPLSTPTRLPALAVIHVYCTGTCRIRCVWVWLTVGRTECESPLQGDTPLWTTQPCHRPAL